VYRYNISYPPGFGICLKVVIFQEKSRFVPRPYVLGLDILCDLVTGKRLLPLVLLVPWSTSGTRGLESLYDRILRQRYSILGLDSRVARVTARRNSDCSRHRSNCPWIPDSGNRPDPLLQSSKQVRRLMCGLRFAQSRSPLSV
jgi:hypothetical protein